MTSVQGYKKHLSSNNIYETTSEKLKDQYTCNGNQSWCIPQNYQVDHQSKRVLVLIRQ